MRLFIASAVIPSHRATGTMIAMSWKPSGKVVRAAVLLLLAASLTASNFALPLLASAERRPHYFGQARSGLSVMTYNVEGLPWPVRWNREVSVATIARNLAALRSIGRQPHVVALQEAFTDQAKRIGVQAGYRYVAVGPLREDAGSPALTARDRSFERNASILKGERSGRLLDSGLMILSDYPILAVRSLPFPAYACAGFDCLANKGMMMALIRVPGYSEPVAIVDVHFNSRRSSGVAPARSDYAFMRQVDAMARFLRVNAPLNLPLIVAGDFNVGKASDRKLYVQRQARTWGQGRPDTFNEMVQGFAGDLHRSRLPNTADVASLAHEKDLQFAVSGGQMSLHATAAAIPFSWEQAHETLSDHIGYITYYAP
jgi:endonuclease/exonuclease/phosphatase family metal-dependent hydrolase